MALPTGDRITPLGTPYHIYQLVLLMLKETAKTWGDVGYAFRYSEDPTKSALNFDTIFNKESGVYGTKPVIIVNRGGISSSPRMLADLTHMNLRNDDKNKASIASSSVNIKIIADRSTEVDILSNEVYNFFLSCRTLLPQFTTIHYVSGISLSPVAEFTEGDHKYYCSLDFSYFLQYKWTQQITTEVLNSIMLHLNHGTPEERSYLAS